MKCTCLECIRKDDTIAALTEDVAGKEQLAAILTWLVRTAVNEAEEALKFGKDPIHALVNIYETMGEMRFQSSPEALAVAEPDPAPPRRRGEIIPFRK